MLLRQLFRFWPLLAILLSPLLAGGTEERIQVSIIADVTELRPGDSFRAGVELTIAEGWHIYGEEPGSTGLPTTVEWDLPAGVTAGPLRYPPTQPFTFLGEAGRGYTGSVVLWSEIQTSETLTGPLTLRATTSWLVCREVCMPGTTTSSFSVPLASSTALSDQAALLAGEMETPPAPPETAKDAGPTPLGSILLIGFLGGLILNLMPCVFPILGLKIMGFVNQAGSARRKIVGHGLVFTAGVLVSFWILAGVLIALRMGGKELGWGFQLQEPGFVLALTVLLLAFGLNMSGVFEFGYSAVGVGSGLTGKGGMAGSFFSGVLATVVATPCAAPFLAPALGAALTLPPTASIAAFTAIALGLALPYLTLSAFPGLVKILPRPGGWMETLKQFLSFLLYATVAFLLWVLAGQVEAELLLMILLALVVVAMGCWIYGRWSTPHRNPRTRWIARLAALIFIVTPLGYAWSGILEQERRQDSIATGGTGQNFLVWENWSPERVASLREEGRFVYVDFTARWCATCQVNKRAYDDPKVINAFLQNDVVLLKADWTRQDPTITRALAEFDRSAVPFNLIYAPGADSPLIMPELFGANTVLEKLKEAGAQL